MDDNIINDQKIIGKKIVKTIEDAINDIINNNFTKLSPGFTFLIRAKNEEMLVKYCLESLIRIFDKNFNQNINEFSYEIIFVDNNSSDNTLEIAENISKKYPNMMVYQYNIDVPKAGILHEKAIKKKSFNTLATYYNWCLSKVTYYNVIKWDCDFIPIKENLVKMINNYRLNTRDDHFAIWFTGKTLYYGKYLKEQDQYDEFRIFSKKHNFVWDNYRGCETSSYYVWNCPKCYINGFEEEFTDIRYKSSSLNNFKLNSPPIFFEIKTKDDIKIMDNILDIRDTMDNKLLLKLSSVNKDEDITNNISNIIQKNYRILITIPSFTLGGGNVWSINLYKALIELGFDIKIYCNFISKNKDENIYMNYFNENDILTNMSEEQIYHFIVTKKINFLLQTTPLLSSNYLKLIKNTTQIIVLTHSDIAYINNYIYQNKNLIDKIITVNQKTINKFKKYKINNAFFLPNYLTNFSYLSKKEKTKNIGIISRLSMDKNIIMTLFAFHQLINDTKYHDYKLHIIGDDCEKTMEYLRFYINKLKLESKVILYGFQKNVVDYYHMVDFIILPSVSEGCPYNLLEAALTGTPIICSDVGGNKEIVGNHAITFKLVDINNFSNNLLYINSYDAHLENIGYKIIQKNDGIKVPKNLIDYKIIPIIECSPKFGEYDKYVMLLNRWNKNVSHILKAIYQMIINYDYFLVEREKLYHKIIKKFSSKSEFMNHLIKILDLDFQFINDNC